MAAGVVKEASRPYTGSGAIAGGSAKVGGATAGEALADDASAEDASAKDASAEDASGGDAMGGVTAARLAPPMLGEFTPGLGLVWVLSNSSALTSRSNCSLNWRAMARARPIQLPTWRATLGSRSGPNTMSAMAEVSSISENPTSSMLHQALVFGGTLTSASRGAAPASKSASFSCWSCFTDSSVSPSFMACLK